MDDLTDYATYGYFEGYDKKDEYRGTASKTLKIVDLMINILNSYTIKACKGRKSTREQQSL